MRGGAPAAHGSLVWNSGLVLLPSSLWFPYTSAYPSGAAPGETLISCEPCKERHIACEGGHELVVVLAGKCRYLFR